MATDRQVLARLPRPPAAPQGRPSAAMPALGTLDMLLAHLEQLAGARAGQRALIIHLSRLHRSHRRDKHLHLVANVLQDVSREYPGRIFAIGDGDLVLVCKGITKRATDEATELLRYVFNDDPLARESAEQADFCALFDLEVDYALFQSALEEISEAAARRPDAARLRPKPLSERLEKGPLDPLRAGELLKALNRVDLSKMVRRRTVWEMIGDSAPRPMFEELFVSLDRLGRALGPKFDLAKDGPLLQHLSLLLDRHILATVVRHHSNVPHPLSIRLGIATLLSTEFSDFERQRPPESNGRIVLEMQLADFWSGLPDFLAIGERLKGQGYLRCLDGLTPRALSYMKLRHVDVDYVKLAWDDALLRLDDAGLRALCEAVAECGAERIILGGCSRREAIRFGQALGVRLFQGWQADQASQAAQG